MASMLTVSYTISVAILFSSCRGSPRRLLFPIEQEAQKVPSNNGIRDYKPIETLAFLLFCFTLPTGWHVGAGHLHGPDMRNLMTAVKHPCHMHLLSTSQTSETGDIFFQDQGISIEREQTFQQLMTDVALSVKPNRSLEVHVKDVIRAWRADLSLEQNKLIDACYKDAFRTSSASEEVLRIKGSLPFEVFKVCACFHGLAQEVHSQVVYAQIAKVAEDIAVKQLYFETVGPYVRVFRQRAFYASVDFNPDTIGRKGIIEPLVMAVETALLIPFIMGDAASVALKNQKTEIGYQEINKALEFCQRVADRPYNRTMIAYHEAGHALISLLGNRTANKVEATLKDYEGLVLSTDVTLDHEPLLALGGYVSEEILFGRKQAGHGAASDLVSLMELAGDRAGADRVEFVRSAYYRTYNMLEENRGLLDILARELLEKGTFKYDAASFLQAHAISDKVK